MFALILTICMAPMNAQGQIIGLDTCEQSEVVHYKTMKQCLGSMDRNIAATKRSVLAPFDWMYSCEKLEK